jgi:hypothetical protein
LDCHRSRPTPRAPAVAQSTSVLFCSCSCGRSPACSPLRLLQRPLAWSLGRPLVTWSLARPLATSLASVTPLALARCPARPRMFRIRHPLTHPKAVRKNCLPVKPLIRFADRTPILFCNFLASTGGVSRGQKVQDKKHTQHFYHAQCVCGALLADGPLPPDNLSSHIAHLLRI